jgi:hypothetical protein
MSGASELPPSFTLELISPVKFDGRDYPQLILQEPTVKQVLRADEQLRNGATVAAMRNREIHLVALVSGLPVPVIEQIRISDLNRSMAYLNPFLQLGLATGES